MEGSRMTTTSQPGQTFAVGDRVYHQKFGDGTIIALDGGDRLVVDFDKAGAKRVVASFVEPSQASPASETVAQQSAEILPFPLRRTPSWRNIQEIYAGRPCNGRYSKANYADGVIKANTGRLQRLGVAPDRIRAEVAQLESLFYRLDGAADEKARA
jgi:hypothetical protein